MNFDASERRTRARRPLMHRTSSVDVRAWRRRGDIGDGQAVVLVGWAAVRLTWLGCHYGGTRPLFCCPECGRSVYVLYMRNKIACRCCHDLAYVSQNLQPGERMRRRAIAIRRKMGQQDGNLLSPFPRRPKYCWRHIHRRLKMQAEEYLLKSLLLSLAHCRRHIDR